MQDDVITAIYDAPLAQQPWVELTATLRKMTGSNGMTIKIIPVGHPDRAIIFADADFAFEGAVDRYQRIYQYKDPVRYDRMAAGQLCRFEDLIDRQDLIRSEFYSAHCEPLNIAYAFFAYVGRLEGVDVWLNGSRSQSEGQFLAEESDAVRQLLPHLQRAFQTYCRMEKIQATSSVYANTTAALGVGIVLLSHDGHVVDANMEANEILTRIGVASGDQGRLLFPRAAQRVYEAALRAAVNDAMQTAQAFAVDDRHGRKVDCLIKRVDRPWHGSLATIPAFALHLDQNAHILQPSAIDCVAQLLGLTQSEARLAVMLSNGQPLTEIAAQLEITTTSARTYCKRVMAKTGTSRQAELVRLVSGGLARLA